MTRMKSWIIGAAAITVLLAAACGGDDDGQPATATPEPTESTEAAEATGLAALSPDEREYLKAVSALLYDITDARERQSEAFQELWPTRERFFDLFDTYDVPAVVAASREAARALDPPELFKDDHAALLDWFEAFVSATPVQYEAVENEDLVGVFVSNAELSAQFDMMLVEADAVVCGAIAGLNRFFLCGDVDPDENPYQSALRRVANEFHARASNRIVSFPPAMVAEELTTALLALQPEIILAFEDAIESAASLKPTEEYAEDHQRYLDYLTERLDLSRRITAAAEEGNEAELRNNLFLEDGRINCSATRDINPVFNANMELRLPRFCPQ
jgi:hypothetical protein